MDTRDAISPAERAALEALYGETEDEPGATAGATELIAGWQPVRAAVAMARDGGFDEEPPARLDALLLAAARQAAPAPRPGWAARLRAWLVPAFAHPALAGAAALVVVGGTAGVLYLRGQGQIVQPRLGRDGEATPRAPGGSGTATITPVEPGALAPMREGARPPIGEVAVPELPSEPSGERPGPPSRLRPRSGVGSSADREVNLPIVRGSAPGVGGSADLEERRGRVEVRETAPADVSAGAPAGTPEDPAAPVPDVTATAGVADKVADDGRRQALVHVEQLTRQARTAAGNGDCGAVKVISARVKKLAAEYHRDSFVTDPAIARCLR